MWPIVKVRSYEMGLYFRDGEFKGLLGEGRYWFMDPLGKVRIEMVSQRAPWLVHEKLDMIVKSGALRERAVVGWQELHVAGKPERPAGAVPALANRVATASRSGSVHRKTPTEKAERFCCSPLQPYSRPWRSVTASPGGLRPTARHYAPRIAIWLEISAQFADNIRACRLASRRASALSQTECEHGSQPHPWTGS